jgi:hypothetical protein
MTKPLDLELAVSLLKSRLLPKSLTGMMQLVLALGHLMTLRTMILTCMTRPFRAAPVGRLHMMVMSQLKGKT